MKPLILTILFFFGQKVFGQNIPLTFSNYGKPIPIAFSKDTFYSSKIHEITLKADSTFEFWSRPHTSCFTWYQYKGTWRKQNDTLFFSDNYEIVENDVRATYQKDSRRSFLISFKTDKNSDLRNKKIQVQYVYDYDAHLDDSEKIFNLRPDNILEISFKDIPNLDQLAAIRIEYNLSFKEKRYGYLTQNKTLNVKKGDIPNVIGVEFVENPQKEIVYRIIKGVVQKDIITIFSITKTKTTLPDYYRDIEFEEGYTLQK